MAQTKRKRRTKHRGTAAGTIETRGRTGRPPSPEERKKAEKAKVREARLSKPPTWRGALNRALLASGMMFVFLLIFAKGNVVAAAIFAIVALGLYVPSGYYLDQWQYRRRMRKKEPPQVRR